MCLPYHNRGRENGLLLACRADFDVHYYTRHITILPTSRNKVYNTTTTKGDLMQNISVVMPCEGSRVPLFLRTLEGYVSRGGLDGVEFIIPTRSDLKATVPGVDIRYVPYEFEGEYFNPATALNLGTRTASHNNIIISCPEVIPTTNVIGALKSKPRGNYVCQVFDQLQDGRTGPSLVNSRHRGNNPGMYFLAMFRREDLYAINGWDEAFMGGYAWEDTDFGARFSRAGLPFEVLDNVHALHQWHQRGTSTCRGYRVNEALFNRNNREGVTYCVNGIKTQDS